MAKYRKENKNTREELQVRRTYITYTYTKAIIKDKHMRILITLEILFFFEIRKKQNKGKKSQSTILSLSMCGIDFII